jgi:hypothetical protein
MYAQKLAFLFLIFSFTIGCSPATVTPSIPVAPTEVTATITTTPTPSVTVASSATPNPDSPQECINLTSSPFTKDGLNGSFVVYDFDNDNVYLLDPKSDQLVDIEKQIPLSWDAPDTDVSSTRVSPNGKYIQAHLADKDYEILTTVSEIINTYSTQGQEDWNGGRWLDNESLVFQHWLDAPHGTYKLVIYNPFTGEEKNMQVDLPNPSIVEDTGGKFSWVKASIDPSLKRVLYNDADERLVLWDLDTQKEITSLPAPTDLTEGAWSQDGKEFATPSPSSTSSSNDLFTVNMDGTVKQLTHFNPKYPFANVDKRPSWSPDGHSIAFWLKISDTKSADPRSLQQFLAITDTSTLDTQIFCLTPNKPPRSGGRIVWSPDSQQVIVNSVTSGGEVKPTLVDLTHLTQTTLDTHGLTVSDWMAP